MGERIFGGARLPNVRTIQPKQIAQIPPVDEKGLRSRRAVAHDTPRLGAFNGLTMVLGRPHQKLRCTDPDVREPRPTMDPFRPFAYDRARFLRGTTANTNTPPSSTAPPIP